VSSRVLSEPEPSDFYDQPGRHTPVLLPSTGRSDPYPAQLTALAQNVAVRKENIWLEIVPALSFLHSLSSLFPFSSSRFPFFIFLFFLFIYYFCPHRHHYRAPISEAIVTSCIGSSPYFLQDGSLRESNLLISCKAPRPWLQFLPKIFFEIMRPCYLNIIFPMGFNSLRHNDSTEGQFQIFSPGKF